MLARGSYLLLFFLAALRQTAAGPAWKVIEKTFSALTIGIAFENDTTGWTSQTSGSSAIQIVKTTDSGKTWNKLKNTSAALIMGFTAGKGESGNKHLVGVTGLAATKYSHDGVTFKGSLGGPLVSQDIEYQAGHFAIASSTGACLSHDGVIYTCHKVPFKNPETGRYIASPSKDVIYMTAGTWPSKSDSRPGIVHLSRGVRVRVGHNGVAQSIEVGPEQNALENDTNSTYTAEIWKSEDGGHSFKPLFYDEGSFYFNDIDCFDELNCVAVAEGFAQDGSKSPGARVYVTSDGVSFKLVHTESSDGASLMAAKMISQNEHWAGGSSKVGGLAAPVLALHSKDAGGTYANEDNGVTGQMITAMDFVSTNHAYATTVNALQVCSLLEYS